MIPPGQTIGILGGGQLGRMMAIAAHRLGYHVIGLDPDGTGPLAQVADTFVQADYDDVQAAAQMAHQADIVTIEFENIPASTLQALATESTVAPGAQVLATTRHRIIEKSFLRDNGFPVTRFGHAHNLEELTKVCDEIGLPAIIKTCEFGYDGKGQCRVNPGDNLAQAWESLQTTDAIVEAVVPFEREISVICTRNANGNGTTFPVFENEHANHILDVTRMPARLDNNLRQAARKMALDITAALNVVGTLAVEMFVINDPETGYHLLVNELAPRPHNSGHVTIDACRTDQFEQHIRAICGLPLGSTDAINGAGAMVNLLGDIWADGEPNWAAALESHAGLKAHLYGKDVAKNGRKMGHLNLAGSDADDCVDALLAGRTQLSPQNG